MLLERSNSIQFEWMQETTDRRNVDAAAAVDDAVEDLVGHVCWLEAREEPIVPVKNRVQKE